jgi:hypothetical protein
MSFKNPKAVRIENPANIHKAVQLIQVALAGLPWVEVAYGLASTGISENIDGTTALEPEAYIGNGKYQILTPNNFIHSHLFFKQESPERPVDYQPFQINQYEADLSIIFLFNLEKIKKTLQVIFEHRFIEELKNEVLGILQYHPNFIIRYIYDDPREVFNGYTYDHLERQTFKHPEAGFKIEGRITFTETCAPLEVGTKDLKYEYTPEEHTSQEHS